MFNIFKLLFGSRKSPFSQIDWYEVQQKVTQITLMAKSTNQAEQKQAFMQFDSVINQCLEKGQVRGNTFGERLKNLKTKMPRDIYSNLWQAHIKRNELAHEPNSHVEKWEADKYIAAYQRAISYLRGLR